MGFWGLGGSLGSFKVRLLQGCSEVLDLGIHG